MVKGTIDSWENIFECSIELEEHIIFKCKLHQEMFEILNFYLPVATL